MTTIIALPDLHGEVQSLDAIGAQLGAVDLVVLPGDLTTNGGAGAARQVVEGVRRYNQHVLAVPGNWDGPAVSAYLSREGINLDRRHITGGTLTLLGAGGSLHSPFQAPNEVGEDELAQALEQAADGISLAQPAILICHQPPAGTLNARTLTRLDVGSVSVRSFIERTQPLLCLTGHIHEGVGLDLVGRTEVLNPGPLWQGHYAFVEVVDGHLVTLEIRSV